MALSKTINIEDNFGVSINFSNAYFKVNEINGGKNKLIAYVHTSVEKNGQILEKTAYEFAPDLDGDNFIKQAYNYLKTMPEFLEATDV